MLRNAGEHARPDFLAIVKREHEIRPAVFSENPVRASLSFDPPAETNERFKNLWRFSGSPLHVPANGMQLPAFYLVL